jgi:L-seryl-tRNA(Ser) seleniumtransferase
MRPDAIAARATAMATQLRAAGVDAATRASHSTVGGGSAPGTSLATTVVAVAHASPDALLAALRRQPMPVIARIEDDRVCLDPRTIAEAEDQTVVDAVIRCWPREKGEASSQEGSSEK